MTVHLNETKHTYTYIRVWLHSWPNRSALLRNRPVHVNRTGLVPNRPVHDQFGTKPVGRSGQSTGSDRWPNEPVKSVDSGSDRSDF